MLSDPRSHRLALLWIGLTCYVACAPAPAEELVAPGAKVERLADGFVFTEGPACDAEGNVYFSDIPNERIHVWSTDGKLSTFRENSGHANGLYFDQEGNLYLARNVVHVYSPEGRSIATIEVPEAPANVCFGGKDRRTLFITARKGLYSIRMNVRAQ